MNTRSVEREVEPALTPAEVTHAGATITLLRATLAEVIQDKRSAIDDLLLGVVGAGHVLIEDVPGVGKTTLAKALARSLALDMRRVQFTPDLLPSDIIGSQVLNPETGSFRFQPGPIFTHLLLADEINRASPRTQSALLEAMSEQQVTVDGVSHRLPQPFLVLATQNPIEAQGTYPLPEAQLDRFMVRLRLGYPGREGELAMLAAQRCQHPVDAVQPVADADALARIQRAVRRVSVRDPVAHYLLDIIDATRRNDRLELGASPRATLMLYLAAQARALLAGRAYVVPDDVQAAAPAVLPHRLLLTHAARYGGTTTDAIVAELLEQVPVPA